MDVLVVGVFNHVDDARPIESGAEAEAAFEGRLARCPWQGANAWKDTR